MAMFTVYPAPQLQKILRDMEVEYSADATPVDLAYQVERSINEKQMVHPLIEQRVHIATITMKMAFDKTPEGKLNIDLAPLEILRHLALEVNLFDWQLVGQLVGQLLIQQGHHPTSHQFDELWEEFNQAVSDPVEEYRQEIKRLIQHRLLQSIQTVQALDRQISELTVDPTEESTD